MFSLNAGLHARHGVESRGLVERGGGERSFDNLDWLLHLVDMKSP